MDGVLETGLQLKEPQLRTTKLFARSGYGSLHTGYFLSLTILPVPIERRSFSGSSPFFSHIAATRHAWRHCLCGIAPFVDVALRVVARTILCVTQELTFAPGYTRHGLLVSTASCILLQVLERMVAGSSAKRSNCCGAGREFWTADRLSGLTVGLCYCDRPPRCWGAGELTAWRNSGRTVVL